MNGEFSPELQIQLAMDHGYYIKNSEINTKNSNTIKRDTSWKIISPDTYNRLSPEDQVMFVRMADWSANGSHRRDSLRRLLTQQAEEPISEFFMTIFDRKVEIETNPAFEQELLRNVLEGYRKNGVNYVELRIEPFGRRKSPSGEDDPNAYLAELNTVVDLFNEVSIKENKEAEVVMVRFVVQVPRDEPGNARTNGPILKVFALAQNDDEQGDRVVGVDLSGLERVERTKGTPADFQKAFAEAKQLYPRVHMALHAGESNERTPHVRDSLLLGAERIGHGLNLRLDPFDTMGLAKSRPILIEICLNSNRLLYKVPINDHSFRSYLAEGLKMSLNTDDGGIFETTITDEFAAAVQAFDLTWQQVEELCENSLLYAFCSDRDKKELLATWKRRWEYFSRMP